jgi:CRISPR-associated protein Cas6
MAIELEVQAVSADTHEMLDIVFDLAGTSVVENYPYKLWSELIRYLPWLIDEKSAGVHPLRGSASGVNILLSKRTKLILRIPEELAKQAVALSGQQLDISGSHLVVGSFKPRPLQAATTLHAYIVESNLNEVEFLAEMKSQLQAMNIACNLICDKHRKISDGKQTVNGFGLVLHDLKAPASLKIQSVGLGGSRNFGCGILNSIGD